MRAGSPRSRPDANSPPVCASSATIAPSGMQSRRARRATTSAVSAPVGASGRAGRLQRDVAGVGAERVGEVLERDARHRRRRARACALRSPSGTSRLGLSGIGEERHRRRACRRARGGARRRAARARTRRSSRAVRPAGGPRRARAGPGTPRRAASRPVACATRLAASSPRSRNAAPPSSSAAGSPERNALATASIVSPGTSRRRRHGACGPPVRRLRATSCRPGG